jgi:DNA integrity scanning protein DisA with diadenylate cyclase activity
VYVSIKHVHYFHGYASSDNILRHANQAPLALDKFKHVLNESKHVYEESTHILDVSKIFEICFFPFKDLLGWILRIELGLGSNQH